MTREEILAGSPTRSEAIDVPEWGGGPFTIRALNCIDRVRFFDAEEAERLKAESPARLGVLLLIACLLDAQGQRVFNPDDAPAIEKMDGGLINRLCTTVNKVNAVGSKARAAAEKK